jgi:hypothetical protein
MCSMTQSEQNRNVDDFDLMFNYYYDLIYERYRMFWNNYFRLVFGNYDILTKVESSTLEDLR